MCLGSVTRFHRCYHHHDGLFSLRPRLTLIPGCYCLSSPRFAGLLNVLLPAGPRLVPHRRSRIHLTSMIWQNSGQTTMPAYLAKSFGGSSSLLPTLTGLRLCTDTRFGRPEPYSQNDRVATRASNTRHLQFAPAGACAHATLSCSYVTAAAGAVSPQGDAGILQLQCLSCRSHRLLAAAVAAAAAASTLRCRGCRTCAALPILRGQD